MRKGIIFATLLFASAALVGTAFAGAKQLSGTLVKIDGEMYTVKDEMDKEHTIHVDPKSTKKEGDLKTGAMVTAEVDSNGHAVSIEAESEMDME